MSHPGPDEYARQREREGNVEKRQEHEFEKRERAHSPFEHAQVDRRRQDRRRGG